MKGPTHVASFRQPRRPRRRTHQPCDLYAFAAAPGTTALILTINPDAGRSSPTRFRPDALYELAMASNGGTSEDLAFRVTFTEPDQTGRQQVQVRRANGPAAGHGAEGILLGEDRTGAVFPLDGNGLAWAGLAADPFTGDALFFNPPDASAPAEPPRRFPTCPPPSQPNYLPSSTSISGSRKDQGGERHGGFE